MRIGLFSDTYTPEINGVAVSVLTLQQELVKHGHDVFVVTTHNSLLHTQKDGNILRLPGIEIKKLYGYVMSSPFQLMAINEVRSMKLDIIHVHTEFGIGIYGRMIAYALKIPIVCTYHTTYEDYAHYFFPTQFKSVDKLARKTVASLSKMAGDTCLEIISPSEKTKELLLNYNVKKPITVVPTGIDLARFSRKNIDKNRVEKLKDKLKLKEKFVVLFIGRIAEEKNIDMLIRAFPKIAETNKDARLLIVGGGPSLDGLKELAVSLDIDKYVVFTDKVDNIDVPIYYQLADVFVSSSVTETQGLTFIEALASGLVIYAKDRYVIGELIDEGNNGYFFDDVEDLAVRIIEHMNLPNEKKNLMIDNALKKVEVFDSEYFYREIFKVYQRVVENYNLLYEIIKIGHKVDCVELTLKNEVDKVKVLVKVDTYYDLGIRKDQVITNEMLEYLKNEEQVTTAYYMCLNKITFKDRTVKEIYDLLNLKTELNIKSINDIVEQLKEKGYLDDQRYISEYLGKKQLMLYGEKKIIRNLVKKGINMDLIKKTMEHREDVDEYEIANQYLNKIASSIRGKSINEKKNLLKKRLFTQGFSEEVTNQAINDFNFNEDNLVELNNLDRAAHKAYIRYARKYRGSELRNNLFRYLATKGYRYEDIYVILDKMEWNDEN